MSVWGKLAGAAAGLLGGEPVGRQVGPAESEVAFTVGVISLGAIAFATQSSRPKLLDPQPQAMSANGT